MTTPKKTKEEIFAEMNAAAREARAEFNQMRTDSDGVTYDAALGLINAWWERWFQKAGHKRLAYILMGKKLKDE